MISRLQQLTKLTGIACLIAILYGCSASTPVVQTEVETATADSEIIAVEPPPLAPEIVNKFMRGMKYMLERNYDKAEEYFLEMTMAHPNLSGAYANLGSVLKAKEDYENAELALQQALRLNNENAEVYNHLGLLYRQTGRFDDALQIYKQGLMIAPKNTNLLRNTGILLELYFGSGKAALEYYQRYLEEKPDDKQVQLWASLISQQVSQQADS